MLVLVLDLGISAIDLGVGLLTTLALVGLTSTPGAVSLSPARRETTRMKR